MKKTTIPTCFFLIAILFVSACKEDDNYTHHKGREGNNHTRHKGREKMEKNRHLIRIGIISKRLNFSPEKAEKFWPVYNALTTKRDSLRKNFKKAHHNLDENAGESDYAKLLELGMELEQKKIDLEKEYSKKLLRVLSAKQVVELKLVEMEIKHLIHKRHRHEEKRKRLIHKKRIRTEKRNHDGAIKKKP